MILEICSHAFHYECEKLCRVFFPNEKITVVQGKSEQPANEAVLTTTVEGNRISAVFSFMGNTVDRETTANDTDDKELLLAQLIFDILSDFCFYRPKWGVLTGVRPSKLFRTMEADMGKDETVRYFNDKFLVSPDKTELTRRVAQAEERIISLSKPESVSLYVSIPFCPTRCSYCSFVSHSIREARKLIPDYLDRLCEELRVTGNIVKALGLRLETVYFGGGTPTTLEAEALSRLLFAVGESFDLSTLREFTVEAGRPDTITREKLKALKNGGVGRISINPQTFCDEVLRAVGRPHTGEDTVRAFYAARELGFDNINMDLIAGLPKDTTEGFCASLQKAIALDPENITVHTLALKRSSALGGVGNVDTEKNADAERMLTYTNEALCGNGYAPYYMYRQSKTLGNLENTGFCKPGYECLYNIFMMEECHTVLAAGAGAVTRLRAPHGSEIERIFNFKYPYEYISRFSELTERKNSIKPFYDTYKK